MYDLYLDIDGVLLRKDGKPARHLDEFLEFAVNNFHCYWLTTHCKGSISPVLKRLHNKVSPTTYQLIHKIKPTNWQTWKTEAINFKHGFFWLDDGIFLTEEEVLIKNHVANNFIKVSAEFRDDLLYTLNDLKHFVNFANIHA